MTGTYLPPHAPPQMRISCDRSHAMIEQGILTEDDRIELINGYLITKMSIGPWPSDSAKRPTECPAP